MLLGSNFGWVAMPPPPPPPPPPRDMGWMLGFFRRFFRRSCALSGCFRAAEIQPGRVIKIIQLSGMRITHETERSALPPPPPPPPPPSLCSSSPSSSITILKRLRLIRSNSQSFGIYKDLVEEEEDRGGGGGEVSRLPPISSFREGGGGGWQGAQDSSAKILQTSTNVPGIARMRNIIRIN